MRKLTLLLIAISSSHASAQTYSLAWQTQFGSPRTDYGYGVANDPTGNVYIAGETYGTFRDAASIGVGPGFVRKYDASGSMLWSRQFGVVGDFASANAVAADHPGNIFIAGAAPHVEGGVTYSDQNAFVSKLDASGNSVWTTQIGQFYDDGASSLTLDRGGNIIIGGSTSTGVFNRDSLVAKYDGAGNLLWNTNLGMTGNSLTDAVAANSLGDIFVAGRSGADPYLAKLDPQGNKLWSSLSPIGIDGRILLSGLVVDPSDNVYLCGATNITQQPTNSMPFPTGPNIQEALLTKLDSAGHELWTRLFRETGVDASTAVAIDSEGNPYITGSINDDPQGNSNKADLFVAKYNAAGDILWSTTRGSDDQDMTNAISVDQFGGYIAGITAGRLTGSNYLSGDTFLIKFSPVPEPTPYLLSLIAGCYFAGSRRAARHLF